MRNAFRGFQMEKMLSSKTRCGWWLKGAYARKLHRRQGIPGKPTSKASSSRPRPHRRLPQSSLMYRRSPDCSDNAFGAFSLLPMRRRPAKEHQCVRQKPSVVQAPRYHVESRSPHAGLRAAAQTLRTISTIVRLCQGGQG